MKTHLGAGLWTKFSSLSQIRLFNTCFATQYSFLTSSPSFVL